MGWLHNLHAQSPERQHASVATASLAYTSATFLYSFFFFVLSLPLQGPPMVPASPSISTSRQGTLANRQPVCSRRGQSGAVRITKEDERLPDRGHAWWDTHALPPY